MSRKFYACQCLFKKGREAVNLAFGKTIYVFTTLKDRNEFVEKQNNKSEFYTVSQKEAYAVTNLNKSNSVACVYSHSQNKNLFVLADIKQCYGDKYIPMNEFA